MTRPRVFDQEIALILYRELKTDLEIAEALGTSKTTIRGWRQREDLKTLIIEKRKPKKKRKPEIPFNRKSYKAVLTPIQAKHMNKFLRALSFAGKEAVRCGVKPDVLHFMNVWSGRYKSEEEKKNEHLWAMRERDSKRRGVS